MPTRSYVDLIFAFGHARLGNADAARLLLEEATAALAKASDAENAATVHRLLSSAFRFRIEEAIAGRRHRGSLPKEWHQEFSDLQQSRFSISQVCYSLDRIREHLHIIEPSEQPDAYREFSEQSDVTRFARQLRDLSKWHDPPVHEQIIRDLLRDNAGSLLAKLEILRRALSVSCRLSDEFANELLAMVEETLDSQPATSSIWGGAYPTTLLDLGLNLADHLNDREWLRRFPDLFRQMEHRLPTEQCSRWSADEVVGAHIECLIRQQMFVELERALEAATGRICQGKNIAALQAHNKEDWPWAVLGLLPVGGGWLRLGRRERAEQITLAAFDLVRPDLRSIFDGRRIDLRVSFLAAIGHDSYDQSLPAIEHLFRNMRPLRDPFTTSRYFGLSHLQIAEAAVLAVIAEDRRPFSDTELAARREFLLRLRGIVSETGWDNPKA